MHVRHNITLDEEVSNELESISNELGEKKSYIIEKALTLYFDMLDLKLAKKRLKELRQGKDKLIDENDAWEALGI